MPRFYFDLFKNDVLSIDDEGQEFAGMVEAHREAVLTLAEMAAEQIPEGGVLDLRLLVKDEQRRLLAQARMHFEPFEAFDEDGTSF